MDILNDIVNILCARIVFSNEYMNIEYKDIKSITVVGNEQ